MVKKTGKLHQTGTNRQKTKKALQVSESRYRRLFETARDGILLLDAKTGGIFDVNPFLMEILGYSRREFLGKHLWDLGFFKDIAVSKSVFRKLQTKGYVRYKDLPLLTKDGRRIDLEFVSNAYRVNGKKVIQCNIRDITDRKKTENMMRKQQEEIQIIMDSVPAMIFYKDKENRFIRVNRAFAEIMEKPKEELEGKSVFDLYPKEQAEAYWRDDKEVMASGEPKRRIIETMETKRGILWVQTDKIPYRDAQGNIAGIIGFTTDITERKKMEEEIRTLSLTDELTNLYNRRGFFTLAEQQLYIARRAKREMFLLYADVDNLKWINDTFGHQEGDLALADVADIIKTTFRESDIVARIGGDEFVILATETVAESKKILLKRLQENLNGYNSQENQKYELSLSTGVVFCDPQQPHHYSLDNLIAQADKSMYKEKITKRNAGKRRRLNQR
ncbi:MAG: diguanylate cyclase [Candidatus Omnitrophota bacterium]